MKVCFVNLYKDKILNFNNVLFSYIKKIDNKFEVLIPADTNVETGIEKINYIKSKGINTHDKINNNKFINRILK